MTSFVAGARNEFLCSSFNKLHGAAFLACVEQALVPTLGNPTAGNGRFCRADLLLTSRAIGYDTWADDDGGNALNNREAGLLAGFGGRRRIRTVTPVSTAIQDPFRCASRSFGFGFGGRSMGCRTGAPPYG